jgi:integral membrane protein (TIGR01906 family)
MLVVLAVFLFLPATNVLLLATPEFVALQYWRPGFPPADRYDARARLELSQATVRWLNSGEGIEALGELRHGDEAVYNERELQHMADVKVVIDGLRWIWRLAGLVLVGALAAALWQPAWRQPLARSTFLGSALLVAVLAGILIYALLSFDAFFVSFHEVFFPPGTWTFDYRDSLIQLYPLEFWMDATWILGAASLVGGLLAGVLGYICVKRKT